MAVFSSANEMCCSALQMIVDIGESVRSERSSGSDSSSSAQRAHIALSGGSTPKLLYQMLRERHPNAARGWFQYYFGDVRMVPDDSADSNYAMAHDALLKIVPAEHVVPIDTVRKSATESAQEYSAVLKASLPAVVADGVDEEGCPQFDIVLLGVGPDGHTASLFPGTPAACEERKLAVDCMPNEGITPYVPRVTVSRRVIHAARHVIVMATGKDKKWVLDGILASDDDIREGRVDRVPVARLIRECRGEVSLLVDQAMATGEVSSL